MPARPKSLSFRKATRHATVTDPGVTGTGPRMVLVHGSFANAEWLWPGQAPLAESFTLVTPNRSGYPPNPPREQIDFNEQAADLTPLLGDGAHLVGYSYGGVVSLLAAARRPAAVRSLTVIEPPALWLARGNPAVDELARRIFDHYWSGPSDPLEFVSAFLPMLGSSFPPLPALPPDLEQGARALMAERPPWDARFDFDALAGAPFPTLVVSGGHSAALDAVCDVIEEKLGAERAVVPGGGHNIPQLGDPFNAVISDFVERAESRAAVTATT